MNQKNKNLLKKFIKATKNPQLLHIIKLARKHFRQTGTDQRRHATIAEYAYTYTLGKEKKLPEHFYLWYYLEGMTAFTYLGIKDIPLESDGPFKNFQIRLMTADGKGIPKRCYDKNKYEFCHLFALQQKGEPVLIAECSVEENAIELIEKMARHLNPQQPEAEKWPDSFTFNSLKLTRAMTLAMYKLQEEETNSNR